MNGRLKLFHHISLWHHIVLLYAKLIFKLLLQIMKAENVLGLLLLLQTLLVKIVPQILLLENGVTLHFLDPSLRYVQVIVLHLHMFAKLLRVLELFIATPFLALKELWLSVIVEHVLAQEIIVLELFKTDAALIVLVDGRLLVAKLAATEFA